MIKDSGNRTEFPTGAVRDIQEGKGRCDLLPLKEVAQFLGDDKVFEAIAKFRETGDVEYLYSAIDSSEVFQDDETTILEVSIHFEEGANKYGEYNWQKGIPVDRYINSAIRHYLKWLRGDKDERHDRAFVWNLLCCAWEVNNHGNGVKTG